MRLNLPDNSCSKRITSGQRGSHLVRLRRDKGLLTRLNRRVFPESHSPTRRTALLTVLLVRKYLRNTEKETRFLTSAAANDVNRSFEYT